MALPRRRVAVLALGALGAAVVPVSGATAKDETCFGRKPDVISKKNDDRIRLADGQQVAVIKGKRTTVIAGGFDSDPGLGFSNQLMVCVKGDHARLFGFITAVHSSAEDTRLDFLGPCDARDFGEATRWFNVYRVRVSPCTDDEDWRGP
jgi:hypothetical protein